MNNVTNIVRVEGPHYALQNSGEVLVKRNEAGAWAPVDQFQKSVGNDELEQNYGLWADQAKVSGHLFWKKTERPVDGQVQPDEVKDFGAVNEPYWTHWSNVVEFGGGEYGGELWKPSAEIRVKPENWGQNIQLLQGVTKIDSYTKTSSGGC